MSTLAFHFVRLVDGVPTLRDGRPMPAVGEWLEESGPVEICVRGLHASIRAIDALNYLEWDNAAVCVVELDGIVDTPGHTDKIVGSRRRVLGWSPCDDLLRLFARECALLVASQWDMSVIVREYLETGNENLRAAARDAARDAARAAARAAASDAAWAAGWAAAWAAGWAAARDAARAAAWAAGWAAARDVQNAILESLIVDACGVEL